MVWEWVSLALLSLPLSLSNLDRLQMMCALHHLTLRHGDATLTGRCVGAVVAAIKEASEGKLEVVFTNLNTECHRIGTDGVEPCGGKAGCVSVKSKPTLDVLAAVKELFIVGLQEEGVAVTAVVASSKPTATSLGVESAEHFTRLRHPAFPDIALYAVPHAKYLSATCINNLGVRIRVKDARARSDRIEAHVGLADQISVCTYLLEGWSLVGAEVVLAVLRAAAAKARVAGAGGCGLSREAPPPLLGSDDEDEEEESETTVQALTQRIFVHVQTSDRSPVVARKWDKRCDQSTTAEDEDRVRALHREQSVRGGTRAPLTGFGSG